MNYGAGTTGSSAGGYKTKDKLDINDPYTVCVSFYFLNKTINVYTLYRQVF